jgi:hypothetical protein
MKLPESTDKLERAVADAFKDVLAAQPGDEARLAAMIDAALKPPPGGHPPPDGGAAPGWWPKLVGVGGLVVAAVALVSADAGPSPRKLPANSSWIPLRRSGPAWSSRSASRPRWTCASPTIRRRIDLRRGP